MNRPKEPSIIDKAMYQAMYMTHGWWMWPVRIFLILIATGAGLGAGAKIMIWIARL